MEFSIAISFMKYKKKNMVVANYIVLSNILSSFVPMKTKYVACTLYTIW
jgi:hypothetical protein